MNFASMSPGPSPVPTPVGGDPRSPEPKRPASRDSIPLAQSSANVMGNADLSQGFMQLGTKFEQECQFTQGVYQAVDANAIVLQQVVAKLRELELSNAALTHQGDTTGAELKNLRLTTEEYLQKSEAGHAASLAQLEALDKRTDQQLRSELDSLTAQVETKLGELAAIIDQVKVSSTSSQGAAPPPPPPPGISEEVVVQVANLGSAVNGLSSGFESLQGRTQQLEANAQEMVSAIKGLSAGSSTGGQPQQDARGVDPMQGSSPWDGATLGGQPPRGPTV